MKGNWRRLTPVEGTVSELLFRNDIVPKYGPISHARMRARAMIVVAALEPITVGAVLLDVHSVDNRLSCSFLCRAEVCFQPREAEVRS